MTADWGAGQKFSGPAAAGTGRRGRSRINDLEAVKHWKLNSQKIGVKKGFGECDAIAVGLVEIYGLSS